MRDTTAQPDRQLAGRREWIGLAVLALPTLLVSVDVYVMLLALPHLTTALHANNTEQLWITDIYGFPMAGFLVTMGTLGDRIGRRKVLLMGALAFAAASVLAAYSRNPEMLIIARAILGVAGAMLAPSTLSLIRTLFRDSKQMGMAFGIWGMCFSLGAIIGPLVGGAMLEHFWWGSVFLLGVPAMVLLLILGPIFLPEYKAPTKRRIDLISVALFLAAILPIVYGIDAASRSGWGALTIVAIVIGLAFGLVFVRRQQALEEPLLDLKLFKARTFSAALGSMLFGTMLMGAMMLFVTQDLQAADGLSPLRTGLWMLPAIVANTVSFMISPVLGQRFRPAYVIGGGLAISVVGLITLTAVSPLAGPTTLAIGFAIIFLGAGPLVTLGVNLVIRSAPDEKAGSAAAMNETSGQLGFALGIAILGSIGIAVYHSKVSVPARVSAATAQAIRDSIADARASAAGLPHQLASGVLVSARTAFTDELHVVAAISAVLLACVAVLAARLLRGAPPTGQETESDSPAAPAEAAAEVTAQAQNAG